MRTIARTATLRPFATATPTPRELRQLLHASPELRFAEHKTSQLIADQLAARGFEVHAGLGGTGLLGTRTNGSGSHIVLRAELDALPISDLKDVPYASKVPGACHACGHDAHMAILIGVADSLAGHGDFVGRLSLLYQPAEEIPFGETSGARTILESGILRRWPVDAMVALHAWPALPVGSVGLDGQVAMAGKYAFRVALAGAGTHAATPHQGRDAILAAAQMVGALHHIVSREIGVEERAVINVGTIAGGRSQSIVSGEAELTGTIRWDDRDVAGRLRNALERTIAGVARAYNVKATVEWANEMPPVRNDRKLVAVADEALSEVLADKLVRLVAPPMTTDDFALYAEEFPCLYLKLGTCANAKCAPLHSGDFDIDVRAIDTGIAALSHLALRLLRLAGPSTHLS